MSNKTHCLSFGSTIVLENPYTEYIKNTAKLASLCWYRTDTKTMLYDISEIGNVTKMPLKYGLIGLGNLLVSLHFLNI